jgi:hypothetical protein
MDAHDEGNGCFIVKMPFMTHNGGRKFCYSKGGKLASNQTSLYDHNAVNDCF